MVTVGVCYTKNSHNAIAACDSFAEGVEAVGDSAVKVLNHSNLGILRKCEVSVQVCDYNKHCGKDFRFFLNKATAITGTRRIIIDTGFIKNKRGDDNDLDRYMQVGFDGIKRNAKGYTKNSPSDRWEQLGIELKPWKEGGEYVLIMGQHEIGISTQHVDIVKWWEDTIYSIGLVLPEMPIKFRPHPNQKVFPKGKYELTQGTTIEEDLEHAYCTVARTTNGAVDSIINGVPVYTPDKACMAYDVANTSILRLENLEYPDRQQWANELAYSQWTISEMKQGLPWKHLRSFIQD
jgi:hypothetical protein